MLSVWAKIEPFRARLFNKRRGNSLSLHLIYSSFRWSPSGKEHAVGMLDLARTRIRDSGWSANRKCWLQKELSISAEIQFGVLFLTSKVG